MTCLRLFRGFLIWFSVLAGGVAGGAAAFTTPPAPIPVSTQPWMVGTIHCPLWASPARWESVRGFPDRAPLLGEYPEGDPSVTDWEIKWSLDHGISFFLVCWYRAQGNYGKPVRPELDHWIKSLDHSAYGGLTRYAIIFENNHRQFTGRTSRADWEKQLVPFWIREYFTKTNYLVLDKKPLLAIYDVQKFVHDMGGVRGARAALNLAREECRKAGFDGLHVIGQYCWGTSQELKKLSETIQTAGMDASWSYHWPTFAHALGEDLQPSSARVIAAQERLWRQQLQPNILTLSMGWDSEPWKFAQTRVQWRLTPGEYLTLCRRATEVILKRSGTDLASRLVLLDNWNEYGEGHYIFPTQQYRFGYLDAVREVFAPNSPEHQDPVRLSLLQSNPPVLPAKPLAESAP